MMDYLMLCELLSNYFDDELERDICEEIDLLIEENFACQSLFNTFNKTLELCLEMEEEEFEVPEEVHIRLFEFIRIETSKRKRHKPHHPSR